jgi:hypothetical protein
MECFVGRAWFSRAAEPTLFSKEPIMFRVCGQVAMGVLVIWAVTLSLADGEEAVEWPSHGDYGLPAEKIFRETVSNYYTVSSEQSLLSDWTGLWCSGKDEVGIFNREEFASVPDKQAPFYMYVQRIWNDSNGYAVQGAAVFDGDSLVMSDGSCVIHAELKADNLLISDNQQCEKISGDFRRRIFKRILVHIDRHRRESADRLTCAKNFKNNG